MANDVGGINEMEKFVKKYVLPLNNIGAEIGQATAGTTDEFWFDYRKEHEVVLFSYTADIGAHHLPSPTAEIKNEWICTSIHHYSFTLRIKAARS